MIQPFRYFAAWPLMTACLLSNGCSNDRSDADAVVQGTVTIDGVLATRGQVTFHPAKQGPVAAGQIHSDGSFSLRVGQGNMVNPDESKIASGEYVATVVVNEPASASETVGEGGPPLAGKRLTAIKYSQKDTSGLKFTVKPGRNVYPIELEGSQNDPPTEAPSTAVDGPTEDGKQADAEGAEGASEGTEVETSEAEPAASVDSVNDEDLPQEDGKP